MTKHVVLACLFSFALFTGTVNGGITITPVVNVNNVPSNPLAGVTVELFAAPNAGGPEGVAGFALDIAVNGITGSVLNPVFTPPAGSVLGPPNFTVTGTYGTTPTDLDGVIVLPQFAPLGFDHVLNGSVSLGTFSFDVQRLVSGPQQFTVDVSGADTGFDDMSNNDIIGFADAFIFNNSLTAYQQVSQTYESGGGVVFSIPEPSSALAVCVALAPLVLRRRRV